jgi:hypothetical protein
MPQQAVASQCLGGVLECWASSERMTSIDIFEWFFPGDLSNVYRRRVQSRERRGDVRFHGIEHFDRGAFPGMVAATSSACPA